MLNNDIHSVIILCGGMSRRMGEDKGSMLINGKPMIIYTIESLIGEVEELIIVLNNQERIFKYQSIIEKHIKKSEKDFHFKIKFVEDEIKDKGPLSGIMTGLKNTSSEYCLILPCDSPFINSSFIKNMFNILNQNLNLQYNKNKKSNYTYTYNSIINHDPKYEIDAIIPYHNDKTSQDNNPNKIFNKENIIENSEPLHSIYNKNTYKKIQKLLENDEKQVKALIKINNSVFVPIKENKTKNNNNNNKNNNKNNYNKKNQNINNITETNFRNINYKKDIEK
ncbi:Molybdenum cofactor guanylyltransferase [Candidatus Methanobinarius endosymbioticus]|uniref:Probable molybdenum cofactor guanylyltransferase n=1 Tax=Candidatus Methanobinarius endosymbioticus TaxID=2006182 RepID=A0A366M947_9EURY|nr:Molybdenum cofactor guanylyltransferase [Candidatus Methanobinarius endosymbioticus]